MIRALIKYTLCFIGVCTLLVALGFFWFLAQMKEVKWVIDRFGGYELIDDISINPVGMDEIYVRSLRLRPQQGIVYDVRALEPCVEHNQNCMLQKSAYVNLSLISTGVVLAEVDEFLDRYRVDVGNFEGGCPVVYETTAVVKELTVLSNLTVEEALPIAQEKLKKIKSDGGLTYSLATPACKRLFWRKPYMARAYIGHLARLMNIAEGRFQISSATLSARYSIRSTIR